MIKNKRGSHVGVVLSFVIFVGFLIFLYPLLIEPAISLKEDKNYVLNEISSNVISSSSSNLKTISIIIDESPQDCVRLENFAENLDADSRLIIINEEGTYQVANLDGGDLEIIRGDDNDVFFKIYNSDEFDEIGSEQQPGCNDRNYEIGFVKEEGIVFENKLKKLIEDYENDYESIKSELNISAEKDFDMTFTYQNGTTIGIKKDIQSSVYSKENQIKYVEDDGAIMIGKVIIRTW